MAPMRTLILGLVLAAAAGPAAAQSLYPDLDNLRTQQEAAARRAVAQENELNALESRLRTEQALTDLRAQSSAPRAPQLLYAPAVTPTPGAALKMPAIPDAALADSNRRVQAAAQPKR